MSATSVDASPGRERLAGALFPAAVAALWLAALALTAASGHGPSGAEAAHAGHVGHGVHGAGAPGFLALLVMWTGMMVAMMVPAEWPALAGQARPRPGGASTGRAAAFLAGHVVVWTAFAAAAALAHWALASRGLTDAAGVLVSPAAGAALAATIGAFQLTPLKRACLERCSAAAVASAPSSGAAGALADGLRHGARSLGSCALLMLLPFAVGGMGLVPMAAITALLVVEKLGRPGLLLARAAGAVLLCWSVVVVLQSYRAK